MSNSHTQVTAMVGGFPPGFRRPDFASGESPFQFVIRRHPDEWTNCVERLGLSASQASALRQGKSVPLGPEITKELEKFQNLRLPSHGRTLMGLAELRDSIKKPPFAAMSTFEICEILWPRPGGARNGDIARTTADEVNATVVALPADATGPMDLTALLHQVKGELWWLLPGATRLFAPTLFLQLQRIVMHMSNDPRCALYSDNQCSMIYRTSALKDLVSHGGHLSADVRENARTLQELGFTLSGGTAEAPLCELEEQFGGWGMGGAAPKRWWQFWK